MSLVPANRSQSCAATVRRCRCLSESSSRSRACSGSAPLTSAGITGIDEADAGAASGLVDTFHRMGMSLGLSVLVAVSASAQIGDGQLQARIANEVSTALTGSSVMLALCLIVCVALIPPTTPSRRSNP